MGPGPGCLQRRRGDDDGAEAGRPSAALPAGRELAGDAGGRSLTRPVARAVEDELVCHRQQAVDRRLRQQSVRHQCQPLNWHWLPVRGDDRRRVAVPLDDDLVDVPVSAVSIGCRQKSSSYSDIGATRRHRPEANRGRREGPPLRTACGAARPRARHRIDRPACPERASPREKLRQHTSG